MELSAGSKSHAVTQSTTKIARAAPMFSCALRSRNQSSKESNENSAPPAPPAPVVFLCYTCGHQEKAGWLVGWLVGWLDGWLDAWGSSSGGTGSGGGTGGGGGGGVGDGALRRGWKTVSIKGGPSPFSLLGRGRGRGRRLGRHNYDKESSLRRQS
ncbi:hypothetical protein M0802_011249 [Mischocyttarus mexicanus]|nr:hypothetical protein M0802_011249 [Mischocyttarus mexicanus]